MSMTFHSTKKSENTALFIHETTHVWQYHALDYKWTDALKEQIEYRDRAYDYTVPFDPDKILTDYRYEQQAEIVKNYYEEKVAERETEAFKRVICPVLPNVCND